MDIKDFAKAFPEKMRRIDRLVRTDVPDIIGVEAVNHYKASFDNQGFTDEVLNPWKEVKRRDPSSPWFGHSGQTGRFSQERTTAPILSGETRELRNAIRYVKIPGGARVMNEKPYAAVHQFGLPAKVYGKKPFVMPRRKFIGRSVVLMSNINNKIQREIVKIIKE